MIDKTANILKKYFDKGRPNDSIAKLHNSIARIDNSFISSSSILLDEVLTGDIYSLKEVIVGENAVISGNITSRTCTVKGKVFGNIISTEYAVIQFKAEIDGDIRAESIQIEPGAVINGHIQIEDSIDEYDLVEMVKKGLPVPTKEQLKMSYKSPDQQPSVDADPSKVKTQNRIHKANTQKEEENSSSIWY